MSRRWGIFRAFLFCHNVWPSCFVTIPQICHNAWQWCRKLGCKLNPKSFDFLKIQVKSLKICCAIKKNVIVTSQSYDVADVQLTVVKESPLELLQFIQMYNLENSVPNVVIMLRIFLTIAASVATCERSFSKLKLIKNSLRSSRSTFVPRCL